MITVQEIQNRIASTLDQTNTITAGTDDWNLRLVYLQRAESEWSELTDWKVLFKEYNYMATSAVTQTLPTDFRKIGGYPQITYDLSTTGAFEQIKPEEQYYYNKENDWFYVLGSPNGGYNLISGRSIASGASVYIPYYTKGASLASPANVSDCPNPEFLVWRAIAFWWEAREDPRSDTARNTSELIKQQMVERENTFSNAQHGEIRNVLQTQHRFRLGRN